MGLFDDILKKPQDTTPADPLGQGNAGSTDDSSSSGSGSNPPIDDTIFVQKPEFLIQKSEAKSLFDIEEKNETIVLSPDIPLEVPEIHAEEGGASVLGVDTPTEISVTESPIFMQDVEKPVVVSESSDSSILGLSEESTSTTDTLFGNIGDTSVEKKEEGVTAPSFLHPKEFIEKSINDIDTMIMDIDTAHASKITEAEGYGAEKDKFATLETNAYTAATKLDEEKAQALHVRELLEKELSTAKIDEAALEALMPTEKTEVASEISTPVAPEVATSGIPTDSALVAKSPVVGSVETTLTGLAVQNTVIETMETKSDTTLNPVVSEAPKVEEKTPVVSLI